MISPTRTQRSYDHRLQAMVRCLHHRLLGIDWFAYAVGGDHASEFILPSRRSVLGRQRPMRFGTLTLRSFGCSMAVACTSMVEFYVDRHNTHLPHSAFMGQTPDEKYFGTGADVTEKLKAARIVALQQRKETNRARRCSACEPVVALGS